MSDPAGKDVVDFINRTTCDICTSDCEPCCTWNVMKILSQQGKLKLKLEKQKNRKLKEIICPT